jgi:hypothetical protein
MSKVQPISNESIKSESEEPREQHLSQGPIDPIRRPEALLTKRAILVN